MKRFSAQELVKLLQERRHLLETVNGESTVFYQGLAREVEVAILAAIGGNGTYVPTPADRVRIAATLERILSNGVQQVLTQAEIDLLQVLRIALNDLGAVHAAANGATALSVSEGVPRRVVETFFAIERRIENREILRVTDPYRSLWAEQFSDRYLLVMREVQRQMTAAAIQSRTNQQVYEALRGPLGTLNLNGHQDPDVWARAFVRTTQHQLYADFSIAASLEAGITHFANMGVPDERQSRECWEASQEPPKTLEEWDGWRASNGKGGRPGERHVFNCRCRPAGIPARFVNDDWSQKNDYWDARVAKELAVA